MGKRKKVRLRMEDDPHGWLVEKLQGNEQHTTKCQHAVTALTGFENIAGSKQQAGSNRPFDHKAADDSIRIDTKTQQQGVLDVKAEKPGKQFTAWAGSQKQFVPIQLVLDSKSESWYVVPGIPSKTLALDPLVLAFDTSDPLAPFKIAGGCLDDLQSKDVFLALKRKLMDVFSGLLLHREIIMKAVDSDYVAYLRSTAEDLAENPDLMQAIAANEDAMHVIASNEEAMRAIASNEEAMRAIASNEEAMKKLLGLELFEAWKKSRPS